MIKITLNEFNELPEQEQDYIVSNEGVFIDHYFKVNQKFSLYAIDQFFVEMEYNTPENQLRGKRSFKTGEELFKYSPYQRTFI